MRARFLLLALLCSVTAVPLFGATRLTYDMGGGEVWSYPVYRFESSWSMDPVEQGLWHVKTTVWMADMDVPPGFIGTKPYPGPDGKTLEYTLRDDPRHPTDGAWTGASQSGRFSHPGRIWYPEATVRNAERKARTLDVALRPNGSTKSNASRSAGNRPSRKLASTLASWRTRRSISVRMMPSTAPKG